MASNFKNLIFSNTSRDTFIVFLGTLINITTGGVFFILAPRILGPQNYGLFATVLSTGILANNLSNFGIDTGILRFAKKDSDSFNAILSLAFKSYLYLGIIVAVLGFVLSPAISTFLNQPQLVNLLRIAFGANIFLLLTNFYVAALQAKGEFMKASIVIFSSNLARLALLIIGAFFISIKLYSITILFFSVTLVSVVIGTFYLPFRFEKTEKENSVNFFKYNFWVAMSLIIPSIPLDNYFLIKISGPLQAGLYAAPIKILIFIYQLGGNFSRVLAPRFASFDTNIKAKNFALKTIPIVAIFILGLVFLLFISKPLVNVLFGESYTNSSLILQILSIGFIFFTASIVPSAIILYYFGNSRISFWVTLVQTTIFLIFLLILIPQHKAIGAAIAFSISQAITFLFTTFYVIIKLSKV